MLNKFNSDHKSVKVYDVAICGGGEAGLTLARQLKLQLPELSVIVIERLKRPLPEATFKVGEATTEMGAFYLGDVLQLREYLETHHLRKMGLRFFFGNSHGLFQNRPELGLTAPLKPYSYQIDRGVFENDLRQFNLDLGVELLENYQIQELQIAENGEDYHTIYAKNEETKQTHLISSRWLIDAMGRRRFLQKKLGLTKANNSRYSAVWLRIEGHLDVSKFVPFSEQAWHNRVPHNKRSAATNHLGGKGYWLWIILLSSGHTSIGLVVDEQIHPFQDFHTYPKFSQWLEHHEPILAQYLRGKQPEDFRKMPRYSYSSQQVFSLNRWACVGEAGTFSEPFYGTGTDMIGFANCLTTQMIELDFQGKLTPEKVDYANAFYLTMNDTLASNIQNIYPCLGNTRVMAMKLIWDIVAGWAFNGPMMFNLTFLDPEKTAKIQGISGKLFPLSHRVHQLFRDWAAKSTNRDSFEFIDYMKIPILKEVRSHCFKANKNDSELLNDYVASMELAEELAQVILLLALEDTMPEILAKFPSNIWLNAWAISLKPQSWQKDGLFRPTSPPRDLSWIRDQLREALGFSQNLDLEKVS